MRPHVENTAGETQELLDNLKLLFHESEYEELTWLSKIAPSSRGCSKMDSFFNA